MEKKYLRFSVDGQIISRTDSLPVVSGTQNYFFAEFSMSEEWEGLHQTAVFSTSSGKHISAEILHGECEIPWEVLRGNEFWVGVFAGDRLTSSTVRVPVTTGVRTNATPGVQPTPSAYEKLVQRTEQALSVVPTIGANGNWWTWDADLCAYADSGVAAQGAKGDPGYTPIKGKDYFDGAPGAKGDPGKDGYTPVKGKDYFDGAPGVGIVQIDSLGVQNGVLLHNVVLSDGSMYPIGISIPQKGVDYWTPEEQQAVTDAAVAAVLAKFPMWEGGYVY